MTFPTPPGGRGRHSEPGTGGQSLSAWAAGLPRQDAPVRPAPATSVTPVPATPPRRRAGVIDREIAPDFPIADYARHAGTGGEDDRTGRMPGLGDTPVPPPPPVPGAPLPPRPQGTWSRLQRRGDVAPDGRGPDGRGPDDEGPDDEATVAQPVVGSTQAPDDDDATAPGEAVRAAVPPPAAREHAAPDTSSDVASDVAHDAASDVPEDDHTGGLEVIVEGGGHRRGRRARRAAAHDDHHTDHHADHDEHADDVAPRKRRRPIAIVLSLVVLAALVGGIVLGGRALIDLVNPADEDYTGQGTGSVQVRVSDGDTLSDIGRTLAEADVIASVGPFVTAAEAQPAAMGIQPGVYGMRQQMSGAAALDLLLDPATRLFSRVTIPEGFTVTRVLERLAEETDTPIEQLNAAAVDPAATGLPAYANGLLEGWLFPATYDFEPETTPAQMLQQMVSRTVQTLDDLGVPEGERLGVVTRASLVQAEAASPEDMAMVAQVLDNRLAIGMKLQLDTTVNYASGKSGITTTAEDRANPSPYNTYFTTGLPPGAISNPGEDALRAVLNPTPGDWLYFVVVNPDSGETRFAVTAEEHQANVLLFQQWLRENPS